MNDKVGGYGRYGPQQYGKNKNCVDERKNRLIVVHQMRVYTQVNIKFSSSHQQTCLFNFPLTTIFSYLIFIIINMVSYERK